MIQLEETARLRDGADKISHWNLEKDITEINNKREGKEDEEEFKALKLALEALILVL